MTTPNQRLRIGRVIAFGVLAEVATILVIVITLTVHSRFVAVGQPQSVIDDFAQRAPAILGLLGGMLFTLIAAIFATRTLTDRIRFHGGLVGVVTAALPLPMLFAGAATDRPLYVVAITFKLVAGVVGGALSERKYVRSVPAQESA